MTHDYKRNGVTTLFAAMNTLDGIGQCLTKHRHQEWLRFLRQIDRSTPREKALHLIADNYATHKPPNVKAWLAKHPRFHRHFTPTSVSWLNRVEQYIEKHNRHPKPFIWTAKASDILAKVTRDRTKLNKMQSV